MSAAESSEPLQVVIPGMTGNLLIRHDISMKLQGVPCAPIALNGAHGAKLTD